METHSNDIRRIKMATEGKFTGKFTEFGYLGHIISGFKTVWNKTTNM
jgi:hypothetical protein